MMNSTIPVTSFVICVVKLRDLTQREKEYLKAQGPGIHVVAFTADDIQGAYEAIIARGIESWANPDEAEQAGGIFSWFKDPDSNALSLVERVV